MQAELETGDNSEVSAAAPNAPIEVRVLACVGPEVTAVRRDDVDGAQVVDREAKAPREAAKPPPSVSPPTPVCDTVPDVVTRPSAIAS